MTVLAALTTSLASGLSRRWGLVWATLARSGRGRGRHHADTRKHYTSKQRSELVDLVTTGRATMLEAAARLGVRVRVRVRVQDVQGPVFSTPCPIETSLSTEAADCLPCGIPGPICQSAVVCSWCTFLAGIVKVEVIHAHDAPPCAVRDVEWRRIHSVLRVHLLQTLSARVHGALPSGLGSQVSPGKKANVS
jgi:hypothetical protein